MNVAVSDTPDAREEPDAPEEPGAAPWLKRVPWIAGAIVALILAGLVGIAAEPTGTARLTDALDSADRLAGQAPVGDAEVVLVSRGQQLAVLVAWRTAKGWLTTELNETDEDPVAAWTSTPGNDDIPALSAAFGRGGPTGGSVEVRWDDGDATTVAVASDGTWLAVREGQAEPDRATLLDSAGEIVTVVEDL